MTKRRLKRPVTLAPSASGKPYDRRSTDLLINAQVAPVEVDDPYEAGAKIIVMRSLRDDPLGRLHDRRFITEQQYDAGREWQRLYEIAEVGGARAIDTTREFVDGGRFPELFNENRAKAEKELGRAAREVGMLGERLLKDVLVNRMFFGQVAAARQMSLEDVSGSFRRALDGLVVVFGFAMRS